jgi:hypothetical protein
MKTRLTTALSSLVVLLATSTAVWGQPGKPLAPFKPAAPPWWKDHIGPDGRLRLPELKPLAPRSDWAKPALPLKPLRADSFPPTTREVPEAARLHLSPGGLAEFKRYVVSLTSRRREPSIRTDPGVAPLLRNKGRFPQETAKLLSPGMRKSFPNLGDHFEVLAPSTKRYNCIAWSVRTTKRWVWPGKSVTAFDRLYARYGYRRLRTMDYRVVPGLQKVVLYGKAKSDGSIECTHGARQAPNGTWTSKLGQMARIRHQSPAALSGPSYGKPIAVYVRAKPAKRSRSGSALVRQ